MCGYVNICQYVHVILPCKSHIWHACLAANSVSPSRSVMVDTLFSMATPFCVLSDLNIDIQQVPRLSVLALRYFFTTTAPPLSFFSLSLHTIHSVLNTAVKVSDGAHHYLPRKTSLKLH